MTDTSEGTGIPALDDLDCAQIGRAAIMLVPICVGLRHVSLDSTIRDYLHPEPGSETDFIRDLFVLPLDEVIEKWYGDRLSAGRIASIAMDAFLTRVRAES